VDAKIKSRHTANGILKQIQAVLVCNFAYNDRVALTALSLRLIRLAICLQPDREDLEENMASPTGFEPVLSA